MISHRAEQAVADEARGLLEELWNAPWVKAGHKVVTGTIYPCKGWQEFRALLDINTPEAHLAAVMMLKKPGQSYILDVSDDGIAAVMLRPDGRQWHHADNEALALIAAIAKSIEV